MLLALSLAVAAAASAPPGQVLDEDCYLVKREVPAVKPRPRPRVIVQLTRPASAPVAKKKRPVPKVDEEVICDDTRPRLPPLVAIPPEEPADFTPAPLAWLETPELPPFAEPPPAVPCECFAEGPSSPPTWWGWPPIVGGPVWIQPHAPATPIPEPASLALLAAGLLLILWRTS